MKNKISYIIAGQKKKAFSDICSEIKMKQWEFSKQAE